MRIDKSIHDDFAVLTLKGEFDTFYCPDLQLEVEALIERGVVFQILDLRLVKFINSTALGAIIKAHKRCKAEGGDLVLSQPSNFVRDVVRKVGIDKLIPMFETETEAIKSIVKAQNARELSGQVPIDPEKVMVSFPDEVRNKMLGGARRTLLGNMANVDGNQIQFTWNGTKSGITGDQARQLFYKDSTIGLKFQIRMMKKSFIELEAKVAQVENSDTGGVRVSAQFTKVSEPDRAALSQFADDLAFLKRQLPR